jgi:hypothetical protein
LPLTSDHTHGWHSQTPKQLFAAAHPPRSARDDPAYPIMLVDARRRSLSSPMPLPVQVHTCSYVCACLGSARISDCLLCLNRITRMPVYSLLHSQSTFGGEARVEEGTVEETPPISSSPSPAIVMLGDDFRREVALLEESIHTSRGSARLSGTRASTRTGVQDKH